MDWILSKSVYIYATAFWISLAASVSLAGWGIWRSSRNALLMSASLLVPSASFLAFQPMVSDTGEGPFWLAAVTFWCSLLVSPALGAWGVWRRSRIILLMGAVLSVPLACYLFLAPGTRAFLVLPILYLLVAVSVRGSARWASWLLLLLIVGLASWFLLLWMGVLHAPR